MILRTKVIAMIAAASLGLGVSALAQGRGRGGSPPTGGSQMGGQRGGPGPAGSRAQAGMPGMAAGQKSAPEMLTSNSKLTDRLATVLGVPSSQVPAMASGFKNIGQFVAAAHVSKNLGIPFAQLSSAMQKDGNLGKAIHQLRPGLSSSEVKNAVRAGNREAKSDISESEQPDH